MNSMTRALIRRCGGGLVSLSVSGVLFDQAAVGLDACDPVIVQEVAEQDQHAFGIDSVGLLMSMEVPTVASAVPWSLSPIHLR